MLLSQEEYVKGVSSWNFDVSALKAQAAMEPDDAVGLPSISGEFDSSDNLLMLMVPAINSGQYMFLVSLSPHFVKAGLRPQSPRSLLPLSRQTTSCKHCSMQRTTPAERLHCPCTLLSFALTLSGGGNFAPHIPAASTNCPHLSQGKFCHPYSRCHVCPCPNSSSRPPFHNSHLDCCFLLSL